MQITQIFLNSRKISVCVYTLIVNWLLTNMIRKFNREEMGHFDRCGLKQILTPHNLIQKLTQNTQILVLCNLTQKITQNYSCI